MELLNQNYFALPVGDYRAAFQLKQENGVIISKRYGGGVEERLSEASSRVEENSASCC